MIPGELDDFASELEARLGSAAEVRRSGERDWPSVWVWPDRAGAANFGWYDGGQWLMFQVGDHCSWELDEGDAAAVRVMSEAVIAGRGYEVTGRGGRHRVVLALPDGTVEHQTTRDGCLPSLVPSPFWPRRSPRHDFVPYA